MATAISVAGQDGDRSRSRLVDAGDLHVPHLLDFEVISVLRRRSQSGDIDEEGVDVALETLRDLPLTRYPHLSLLPRVWELRTNVSPYDGAYIALAEALRCSFVTADLRLAKAPGIRCDVEVL